MKKQPTCNGLEVDVRYGRKLYCYLKNNSNIVKFAKKCMNKRFRRNTKKETLKQLENEETNNIH